MNFDEMIQHDAAEQERIIHEQTSLLDHGCDISATCPINGHHELSGYFKTGHTRWGYCLRHKVCWHAERATFTPADEHGQRHSWDSIGVSDFRVVDGWLRGMKAAAKKNFGGNNDER